MVSQVECEMEGGLVTLVNPESFQLPIASYLVIAFQVGGMYLAFRKNNALLCMLLSVAICVCS